METSNSTSRQQTSVKFVSRLLTWCEPGVLEPLKVDEVERFFCRRFEIMGQVPCKHIQTALLDAICRKRGTQTDMHETTTPQRRRTFYSRKQKDQPDYWPDGVAYECSFKLSKENRLKLLPHLFVLPLKDRDESHAIIHRKYGAQYNSWGELLGTMLNSNLDLYDRDRDDAKNNTRRHAGRMELLEDLVHVAAQVEATVMGKRGNVLGVTNADPKPITYKAVPKAVGLTRGACTAKESPPMQPESSTIKFGQYNVKTEASAPPVRSDSRMDGVVPTHSNPAAYTQPYASLQVSGHQPHWYHDQAGAVSYWPYQPSYQARPLVVPTMYKSEAETYHSYATLPAMVRQTEYAPSNTWTMHGHHPFDSQQHHHHHV